MKVLITGGAGFIARCSRARPWDPAVAPEARRRFPAPPTYCSGIQVIHPAKINEIMSPTEEFNDVWARLIERGELLASRVYPTSWFSVDTVLQLEALNQSRE